MKLTINIILFSVLVTLSNCASLDSKFKHYTHGDHDDLEHNADFDHEAFLGKDGAKEFQGLSPDEARRRLSLLVKKIDVDNDGQITEKELEDWVREIQNRFIEKDVDNQWLEFLGDADATEMTFEHYKIKQYGPDFDENAQTEDETEISYQQMYKRDQRRWTEADVDKDGKLNKKEFAAFMHPEDYPHMYTLTALEAVEEIDKDHDGKISLQEYTDDLWTNPDKTAEKPSWLQNEIDLFRNFRDTDGDGFLNLGEVSEWLNPTEYNSNLAEARHLIHEADANRDGWLSEDEILEKYDVFVGSQVTDYGQALNQHDEF